MEKQKLQNFAEEFINGAIEGSESGSWVWDGGSVEDYLGEELTEEDMETLDVILWSEHDCLLYSEVYRGNDGKVVVDCNFALDTLELACRHAVLFTNTKDGEKYYLQHADLEGDYQDECTDKNLLEQAELLIANDYDISTIDEEFEVENVANAFGIRNIIKTIDFQ